MKTDQGGMITVSDPTHSKVLAADATGLKRHDGGEWTGKKRGAKRGFALHAMADAQAMRTVSLPVTDESVGGVAEFRPLPGQGMDTARATPHTIPRMRGRTPRPGSGTAPSIPYAKTAPRRASRPSHRPRRTIQMVVNRRHSISHAAMPRTAQEQRGRVHR